MNKIGLVFTMHKVGSSTMMQAMRDIGRNPERGYKENLDNLLPLESYEAVVTGVRDPIARNISWFFEQNGNELLAMEDMWGEEILMETFMERVDHTYPLRWFEEVFQTTFGVNVYKNRFAKTRGWSILEGRYLIIQTERMFDGLQAAYRELFGRKPGQLHRAATVETRAYGKLYQEFVQDAKFEADYVDEMLESRYVKHFFLKKQVDEMRMRWLKK